MTKHIPLVLGKLDNHLQNEENHRIRRRRVLFTETQIDILKSVFANQKYLSAESRTKLAESLNLSPKQVKTWFQNYRYKCRRRCYGYGYPQHEDLEILKSHSGTATTMATPVRMSVPHPEGPTVFFGNHHCSAEHYGSTSATHTRYNEHFHPLVRFSYNFPSTYQHLPTYQKHVN
jgi:hypothetical protein